MRVRSKSISSIGDWWGVQESIIDAEYLIPISNACICDRQEGARERYVGRLVPGLMDGGESMDLRRIPGDKAARYAILSFAQLRAWFNGRT